MDNNNFNVKFIELAKYETPVITEGKREDWVMYGEDNNYFQYLIDRYTYSPTNNAIINNIIKLVYGRGLNASDASKKPQQYAQFMTMFNKDCVRKMIMDSKMLGQFAIQVHYSKDHSVVKKAYHIPVQLLRPEKCNKDGEIEAYYYSDNWEDTKNFPPKRIPSFGTSKEAVEILYVRPYSVGMKYFALVDYQGALPYAVLEQEISDYLINEVQNGFSGTKVINFNNGLPPEEEMDAVERKVLGKLTGSKGKRVIVSFNHSEAQKTTVDDIPLNDAPEHYTYLSEECMRKIMLGHNVTSPLLFGISSSNGFSSNADELQNSFILYYNMVIQPYQDLIIEAIDRVLAVNGISLKLYFETLKPLEFTDPSGKVEEPTELSSQDDTIAQALIDMGEDVSEDWLLIDEFEVDYDNDDFENELLEGKHIKKTLMSRLIELVSTGDARPNIRSGQDEVIDQIKFITRYVYAGETGGKSGKGRDFCTKMMDAKKIYRKEDIQRMSQQPVNAGFGPRGAATYDIWFYKGGPNCHHRWNKRVYATLSGQAIDINELKQLAGRKAEKFGYVVKNDPKVTQRPIDMENRGFLPKD
jgi:hypothetical protein